MTPGAQEAFELILVAFSTGNVVGSCLIALLILIGRR